ncbi:MAG: CRISPR-associated helicase Cas3', partial [Dehalococcoidia bacterium]|nr:CRISPR-associated helicase Cas3' [Dehalococcoidia bacterium]
FPYADDLGSERLAFAVDQARRAVRAVGLSGRGARASLPTKASTSYAWFTAPGFLPRPAQVVLDALPLPSAECGSLVVLEAETGAGKTEAAFAHYLRLLQRGLVDGLYFALPTRTAATQIQRRLTMAAERAFPDESTRPPVVLAVPGYVKVDDVMADVSAPPAAALLPRFEVLWPDDERERMRYRGWAAENPKRALAGGIVVGTIDQVLLSALIVRHAHLRAASALRQLLVVDEVHASDTYMNRILRTVIEHQLDAGGHVLLMSATLGASALGTLLTSSRSPAVPPLAAARTRPYPLVSALDGLHWREHPVSVEGYRKAVSATCRPWLDEAETIAREALAFAARGACVLVIRNTVAGCLQVQGALEALADEQDRRELLFACAGQAAPHHSRFAREDRRSLDDAVEAAFGGDVERPRRPVVAIATQTVQQSLDLDADVLVTDLCPMDVLFQRIGRLHRHGARSRPPGFESPSVIVVTPEQRSLVRYLDPEARPRMSHGIGLVYPDLRVLEATWRELEARAVLRTPEDCRELVELTTHDERLGAIAAELGPAFQRHELETRGEMAAHGSLASLNCARWDIDFYQTAAADLGRDVATRLGERDRLLRLESPIDSPFGNRVTALQVPGWMARGWGDEVFGEVGHDEAGRLVLRVASQTFVYSASGLAEIDETSMAGQLEDGA